MYTSAYSMTTLFEQLGLPADAYSMRHFLASHRLPVGMSLADAPYWNKAQARFLREAWREDGDWAELVDELARSLSTDEPVQQMIGRSDPWTQELG
ncbi:MAG: DUF2789 domain-containing protein [Gammaproteobacteria bacterium]|nr:DUF2789 domain-containing protein [Gammaproteobacteria bacterium]